MSSRRGSDNLRPAKHYSESERREIVHRFERSGLSQAEFCRREGLQPWSLSKWLQGQREEKSSELFFEVGHGRVKEFTVEWRGIRVTVPAEFKPDSLRLLLKTIKEAEC